MALEVLLGRGARAEGVVIEAESGRPVAGAAVHAWLQAPPQGLGFSVSPRASDVTSREDGSFILEGLADGSYVFGAAHPLYAADGSEDAAALLRADLSRGTTARIEIRMRPAGSIEGTIRGLSRERTGGREVRHSLVIAPAGDRKPGKMRRGPG
jgi:hypothetical protein